MYRERRQHTTKTTVEIFMQHFMISILIINTLFIPQKFCEIYQGELAVIETEAEQLFIENYLNSTWRNGKFQIIYS
jgi:hypothetical protein